MSMENPQTYGEKWYRKQADARAYFADEEEKVLAPHIKSVLGLMSDLEGFPPAVASFLRAVGTPGNFGLSEVGKQSLSQTGGASLTAGLSPFLRSLGYAANKKFPSAQIDLPTAITLAQRHKIMPELYLSRLESQGFQEAEGRMFYQSMQAFPDPADIIRWARYSTDGNSTFTTAQERLDFEDSEFHIWEWLTAQIPSTSEVQALLARDYVSWDDAALELRRQGWNETDANAILDLSWSYAPASARVQAGLLYGESRDVIENKVISSGVHPDQAAEYVDALLAKPGPQDIIRWRLRSDPSLADLPTDLARIGVHPDYLDVYKTLAFPVPPVGDMITMAVREAFTPDIASRFGQYEDYPTELTKYAAMNGISEEWAKRYWAAHWRLPSPQQGFQMLHRGIIDESELNLLLRASDIMPFWRDKLVQVAYRPLTRVDVRRMFALGVLTEEQVKKAYKDIGYSDDNAELMKEFTAKQVLAAQTGFNTTDVVTAYKNSQVERSEAYNMIGELGVKSQNITNILNAAETQRDWVILNEKIKAVNNQYRQDQLTLEEAKSELLSLRVPTDKAEALSKQWYKETVERESAPWTKAETIMLMLKGIISEARARTELQIIGFDREHTDAIILNSRTAKPKA